jgi:hypothetical protein
VSYTVPVDTHAAGDTGHISDHNNIADVLTALGGGSWIPGLGWQAPTGATAETFPRGWLTGTASAMTSGTLYVQAIGLHQNTVVNNLTFCTRGTAETGGTHCWYVLLDNTLTVRAVTADQTGATALTSTQTPYTFATNAYTAAYSGLYYAGICVVATGMPIMLAGPSSPSGLISLAPILSGSSSTGQTTPPTTGTVMGALTANNGFNFYAYTS